MRASSGADRATLTRSTKLIHHLVMYTTLIQVAELAQRLERAPGSLAVLDCRHDLARPQWSDHTYAEEHIPTAVQAHLDRDLSGPITAASGRHPLPSIEKLSATLGRWGIDADVQVVAYDQGNGMYASRAWWLLRWLGHEPVAVLDGGFSAWQEAGLPVTREPGTPKQRTFVPRVMNRAVLSTAEVQQALGANQIALIDARGADRFGGENETIDPVAGHVPGARNRPFAQNVDARGRFLPAEELRRQWRQALAERDPTTVVAMCGSGVSACHNLLAMQIAGLSGARLYAGSWSEWIRDPARPVARR